MRLGVLSVAAGALCLISEGAAGMMEALRAMVENSIESTIHAYERISLFSAGLVMGLVLLVLHGWVLLRPHGCRVLVERAIESPRAGQVLLGVDVLWFMLLLAGGSGNPMRMELFSFEPLRGLLLVLAPVVWLVFATMVKENLFARALGLFLLMMAIVPMTAAFLKEPASRVLIPLWWYPVIVLALFWVGKPFLFRDWFHALVARRGLCRWLNGLGLLYGLVLVLCALLFW